MLSLLVWKLRKNSFVVGGNHRLLDVHLIFQKRRFQVFNILILLTRAPPEMGQMERLKGYDLLFNIKAEIFTSSIPWVSLALRSKLLLEGQLFSPGIFRLLIPCRQGYLRVNFIQFIMFRSTRSLRTFPDLEWPQVVLNLWVLCHWAIFCHFIWSRAAPQTPLLVREHYVGALQFCYASSSFTVFNLNCFLRNEMFLYDFTSWDFLVGSRWTLLWTLPFEVSRFSASLRRLC